MPGRQGLARANLIHSLPLPAVSLLGELFLARAVVCDLTRQTGSVDREARSVRQ